VLQRQATETPEIETQRAKYAERSEGTCNVIRKQAIIKGAGKKNEDDNML
jgi:hypothetical protein